MTRPGNIEPLNAPAKLHIELDARPRAGSNALHTRRSKPRTLDQARHRLPCNRPGTPRRRPACRWSNTSCLSRFDQTSDWSLVAGHPDRWPAARGARDETDRGALASVAAAPACRANRGWTPSTPLPPGCARSGERSRRALIGRLRGARSVVASHPRLERAGRTEWVVRWAHMSKRVQRQARDRRDAAWEREENARERAARNRERGEDLLARRHEHAADRQAASAQAAEEARLADVAIEGEQLGEPQPVRKPVRRAPDR